jgi:hypothetical protein
LPDFSRSKHTNTGKIYQITTKYTKVTLNLPNSRKIFQMAVKYSNIIHTEALQNIPKLGFLV